MVNRFSQFCYVISGINRYVQKIERDEMEAYGYKGAFAQYLLAIDQHPDGVTAGQLSELCDRDKAAVSRVVAEMEEKGLVIRQGNHYRAQISLTDRGREAARFVYERARVAVVEAGKGLTDEDRAVFYASLDLIAGNLQTLSREGLPKE